jgi:hypothetical protein
LLYIVTDEFSICSADTDNRIVEKITSEKGKEVKKDEETQKNVGSSARSYTHDFRTPPVRLRRRDR